MKAIFRSFSIACSNAMGSAWAFVASAFIVLVWAASGPVFGFSDTWQLVINTGTTVLTFLAVFLIQNTQNRDARAIHLKLDELIRALEGARTELVDLEQAPDEDIEVLADQFHELHEELHLDTKPDDRGRKKGPPPTTRPPAASSA
jgi:low affinity Fe/Cu permease